VTTLLDALIGMLRLEFAYARLSGERDGPTEFVRVASEAGPPSEWVGAAVAPLGGGVTAPARVQNPVGPGEVGIGPVRLEINEDAGLIVAGARRADFPTKTERLLLRVAANQAATWLRAQGERGGAFEWRVAERTREFEAANEQLRLEIQEGHRAEAHLVALTEELASDLSAMTTLHELSGRLLTRSTLQSLLNEVLHATIALQSADFGNVQLYDRRRRTLGIVAQRGFRQDFLEHFDRVHEGQAACGRALRRGERVVIEDVETAPEFEPHRAIAAAAGFRAVQSTPMFGSDGELLGVLSTHFRRPHRPSERELRLTDLYARQAGAMIECVQAEQALQRRTESLRRRYESLTPREHEVMALVVTGRLNKQIAGELHIAEITVKVHRGKVMRKMGAESLAHLVRLVERLEAPTRRQPRSLYQRISWRPGTRPVRYGRRVPGLAPRRLTGGADNDCGFGDDRADQPGTA
jgi:DNA-binding CsgD family transcriptional regulator